MKQGCTALRLFAAISMLWVTDLSHAQSLPPTALKVIHHFTALDGSGPTGKLVQGPDGTLYGVLAAGGTGNQGSIFKVDPTGQFQTLYSFGSSSTTGMAPTGDYPNAGLIFGHDGNLYGTATQGGPNNGGTAFRITVAGELTTLVAFGGSPTAGFQPYAPLNLSAGGNFYGTTNAGGTGGAGTVFRMSPAGVVTVLHNFAGDGSEGTGLYGGLITAADGTVYGTTSLGGFHSNAGDGTVFKIAADGTFAILHYFPYTATNSISGLTAGPDGTFFGITEFGAFSSGDAFSITSDGMFTILHSFGCSCGTPDGSQPVGSLTLASDGNFYGVTSFGGTSNRGTIFRMTPSGVITPLHSFAGADGDAPIGGVIEGTDGRFYGMTSGEFTHNPTIYSLALPPSAPPTNVAAVATDGAVTLTWAATKSANSYSVYQGTSTGAEGATATLSGLTKTSTTVSGLQNGTAYYFQVVAVNEAGNGPASAEVTALPIAAPTNPKATAGNSSILLSWAAAAGATSYSVYEGNTPGGEATGPIATGIRATSFSVTGLADGTAYYFKVASVNGSTTVESTAEVSGTPSAPSTGSSGGGGGGGAMDGVELVVLGLLALPLCGAQRKRFQWPRGFRYQALQPEVAAHSMRWVLAAIISAAMLSLSGCGGGGGTSSPPHFTVGGTVSGLPPGTSIILKDNDGDSITVRSNSSFTFPTAVVAGGPFSVTIATQIPGQTCTVSGGAGTVNAADVTAVRIECVPATYAIGGTVSGLAPGTTLVLNDNGGDPLIVDANSAFTFAAPITAGNTYDVTVAAQPTGQTCVVSFGTGTAADGNVTTVSIACAITTYTISGTVTGLGGGTSIVLQNNGADSVSISTNSRFTFATPIPNAGRYNVTIGTQPLYQSCTVYAGSGTVASAAVTNVVVHCPYVKVLWDFGYGLDGTFPQAGLIQGSDGNLYGTTTYGGPQLWGSVYKMTPSGVETVIASFAAGADASGPDAAVLQGNDGNFYGTTYVGGTNSAGTVFKVTSAGVETVLWSFGSGTDGQNPKAALIQASDGNFYGTTSGGGSNHGGTVFRITPSGAETVLWNFGAGTDGQYPVAALVQGTDGNLYGSTMSGGVNGHGTGFRITLAGTETVLWNFDAASGTAPQAPLIQANDGNFYGTTVAGGVHNSGTVFRITPSGVTTVIYSFLGGTDGNGPNTGVIQGSDGNFYGTTVVGGTVSGCGSSIPSNGACGTIFKVTAAGIETVLWDFGFGGNGASPMPLGLVQGSDGNFYGVTAGSGAIGAGTVYQLVP